MKGVLLLLLLLMGCTDTPPSPEQCRLHGVNVRDGDSVTGKIVSEHYTDLSTVREKCLGFSGCVRAAGFENYVFITPKGEYEVWYSDRSLRLHEHCHALYEEPRHTDAD